MIEEGILQRDLIYLFTFSVLVISGMFIVMFNLTTFKSKLLYISAIPSFSMAVAYIGLYFDLLLIESLSEEPIIRFIGYTGLTVTYGYLLYVYLGKPDKTIFVLLAGLLTAFHWTVFFSWAFGDEFIILVLLVYVTALSSFTYYSTNWIEDGEHTSLLTYTKLKNTVFMGFAVLIISGILSQQSIEPRHSQLIATYADIVISVLLSFFVYEYIKRDG